MDRDLQLFFYGGMALGAGLVTTAIVGALVGWWNDSLPGLLALGGVEAVLIGLFTFMVRRASRSAAP